MKKTLIPFILLLSILAFPALTIHQVPVAADETEVVEEAASGVETTALYRLYHRGLKVHLYTKNVNEYNTLATRGWKQEGVAWKFATWEGEAVYRLYHRGLKVHHYTKSLNEYNTLATRGWKQEGIAFNSYGDVPVYRLYNRAIKRHLFTKSHNEYNTLATRGWKQEGIAFYAYEEKTAPTPAQPSNPAPANPEQPAKPDTYHLTVNYIAADGEKIFNSNYSSSILGNFELQANESVDFGTPDGYKVQSIALWTSKGESKIKDISNLWTGQSPSTLTSLIASMLKQERMTTTSKLFGKKFNKIAGRC